MLKDKDDKLKHKYNIITRKKKRNSTQTATSEKIDVLFEIDDIIDDKDDYEYRPNSTYKKKGKPKRKTQKTKRVTNPMKRRQRKELFTLYTRYKKIDNSNVTNNIIVGKSLKKFSVQNTKDNASSKYNWIDYLKNKYDSDDTVYSNQSIIILTGFDASFYSQSWFDLKESKRTSSITPKNDCFVVTVIPRCKEGQIYYCQCLQQSPHFSLCQQGTSTLLDVLETKENITIINYRQKNNKNTHTIKPKSWFSSLNLFSKQANIKPTVENFFSEIGNNGLWEYFYKVSFIYSYVTLWKHILTYLF